MNLDRSTLNLAAPVLCTLGALVALVAGLRSRPRGGAVLSSLLGLVGSAAWAMSAYQDAREAEVAAPAAAA